MQPPGFASIPALLIAIALAGATAVGLVDAFVPSGRTTTRAHIHVAPAATLATTPTLLAVASVSSGGGAPAASSSSKAPDAKQSDRRGKDVDADAGSDDDDPYLSSMPWSTLQSYALRDKLPQYVRPMAMATTTSSNNGKSGGKKGGRTFALWRTMIRETTELAGYEVPYLRKRYEHMLLDYSSKEDDDGTKLLETTPLALPLLADFVFTSEGGISGQAYGIPGIADGSTIRTTALDGITETVPLGYVRTEDGSAAYELGLPAGADEGDSIAESLRGLSAALAGGIVDVGNGAVSGLATSAPKVVGGSVDGNLVNLAGTTAMALAGAAAVGMLSHHLTVNVFWV